MGTIIDEIYADSKYFKTCQKIAGTEADDLYQHVNVKLWEKEQAGKLNVNRSLYSLYYITAKREFHTKNDSYQRTHHERFYTSEVTPRHHNTPDELTQTTNDQRYELLDDFARTPSATDSEQMVKQVYLETTKPGFKGITDLANRTGINKRTLYGALYRFRDLFNNYLNPA